MNGLRVGLLATSLVLAACAVETGEVLVSVGCAGAGCTDGDLHVSVTDCDEEVGIYGEEVVPASLTTAGGASFVFENVQDGTRCVQAYLDVDTNGVLSAGDIVPSAAAALDDNGDGDPDADDTDLERENEIPVEVEEDQTTTLDVILDTIAP